MARAPWFGHPWHRGNTDMDQAFNYVYCVLCLLSFVIPSYG